MDFWAPKIAAALAAVVTDAQIRAAIAAAKALVPPTVAKSAADDARAQIAAQVAGQLGDQADPATVEAVIRQVIADGWQAGGMAANRQLGIDVPGWDTWEPGDVGAALQAADGGLADMLDAAGFGIQGIVGDALDGLGNTIADGLLDGSSVDDVAASLGDWASGFRAERIAHTETARASTSATLATYDANGIDEFEWVLSDGACEVCQDLADGGPYPADDTGDAPPGHPWCRCAAQPKIDSSWFGDQSGDASAGDSLDDSGE